MEATASNKSWVATCMRRVGRGLKVSRGHRVVLLVLLLFLLGAAVADEFPTAVTLNITFINITNNTSDTFVMNTNATAADITAFLVLNNTTHFTNEDDFGDAVFSDTETTGSGAVNLTAGGGGGGDD